MGWGVGRLRGRGEAGRREKQETHEEKADKGRGGWRPGEEREKGGPLTLVIEHPPDGEGGSLPEPEVAVGWRLLARLEAPLALQSVAEEILLGRSEPEVNLAGGNAARPRMRRGAGGSEWPAPAGQGGGQGSPPQAAGTRVLSVPA